MSPILPNPATGKSRQLLVLFFLVLFFFLFSRLLGQNPDGKFDEGVLYFKVLDNAGIQPSLTSPHDLGLLVPEYKIISIRKAFKTPHVSLQSIYKLTFTEHERANELISDLEKLNYIEYAERAPLYEVDYIPNDYSASQQWSLEKIDATDAWNITTGSSSIVIAIVDNGVNYSHEDLLSNVWVNPGEIPANNFDDDLNGQTDDIHGYDFSDDDNDPRPPANSNATAFRHGTHVAGIASAVTDNAIGISSIGFKAHLMIVKCAPDNSTTATLNTTFEGVDYAINNGADIVCMSFGSATEAATWTYLTTVADALGVILIAAAGNDATSTPYYPAASNHVIAVGATESNDTKASYSNYGSWIDLMAPGSGIYSTLPDGGDSYGTLSGTSMSCPLVAGVAALILSTSPSLNPSQVEVLLEGGCENISPQNPNYPGQLGAGRLNAYFSLSPMATFGQQPLAATLQVFPNVGDGLFQIKSDRNFHEQLAVEIYNTAGIKVDAVTLPAPSESGLIELNLRERLPDGAYILRFSDKSGPLQSVRVIITAAN